MSNRREFLQKSLMGAAAVAVPAAIANDASANSLPLPVQDSTLYKIGYQLYGVREMLAENPDSTMKLVSELGFEGVEYSGMTNTPAINFRLLQNKYNMVCCGIHYGLTDYIEKGLVPKMEYNYILGNKDIACHWLDPKQRGSLENYLSNAQKFNEYAPVLKNNGFNFYYHNHSVEFTDIFNGKFAMDIMLENTDPALFFMELHIAGIPTGTDVVQYIDKLGGRLLKMHIPVLDKDGNILIKQEIIDAAKRSGTCKWFIIEQTVPDKPTCESLARSVEILRKMLHK
jgi:sugar phosphate isomerase/epimerase